MALNWHFEDDYLGQVTIHGEFPPHMNLEEDYTYNCYSGNALLIMLAENTERYSLHFFLSDEAHLKNCLKDPEIVDFFKKCEFTLRPSRNTDILYKHLKGVSKFTMLRKGDELPGRYFYDKEESK